MDPISHMLMETGNSTPALLPLHNSEDLLDGRNVIEQRYQNRRHTILLLLPSQLQNYADYMRYK